MSSEGLSDIDEETNGMQMIFAFPSPRIVGAVRFIDSEAGG